MWSCISSCEKLCWSPVQGFIRKNDNKIILSMTIRRAFADEFWFTLFHEIGHLLNGVLREISYRLCGLKVEHGRKS